MKKWLQYGFKQLSDINKYLETNCELYSVLRVAVFLITIVGFHPQYFIERNESIIKMFFLPLIVWFFLWVIITREKSSTKLCLMAPKLLWNISWGGWYGMIIVSAITVNEWFIDPHNGKLEPYFIATTLSAAVFFSAFKKLDALVERY